MDKPYPRVGLRKKFLLFLIKTLMRTLLLNISQGEILIGGGNVALGYYKLPPTDEFFMDDGKKWFRTGDIGQMYHDGVCQIIGENGLI